MGKVHVYRAGNMTQKVQTEEKKKIIIRNLLNKGSYTKAIMYDDAEPNLQSFVELKQEYPKTKFYAWHVSLEGEASEYHRTNETQNLEERRKKKRKPRHAAYGPGLYGGYGYYANYASSDSSGDAGGGDGGGESINHENFADGKNPQDKGDSKRHGVPTKASVSTLRKVAKQGGRKGQLAHWMANMKAGKAKKK
jgi:hypothetical protein